MEPPLLWSTSHLGGSTKFAAVTRVTVDVLCAFSHAIHSTSRCSHAAECVYAYVPVCCAVTNKGVYWYTHNGTRNGVRLVTCSLQLGFGEWSVGTGKQSETESKAADTIPEMYGGLLPLLLKFCSIHSLHTMFCAHYVLFCAVLCWHVKIAAVTRSGSDMSEQMIMKESPPTRAVKVLRVYVPLPLILFCSVPTFHYGTAHRYLVYVNEPGRWKWEKLGRTKCSIRGRVITDSFAAGSKRVEKTGELWVSDARLCCMSDELWGNRKMELRNELLVTYLTQR